MKRLPLFAIFSTVLVGGATDALADDADKRTCANLTEGAACIHHTGDPGVCVPDASDPSVLTCEDTAPGGTSGGGSGACDGLSEGDSCAREDGSGGTCVPDASDPGKLECEDHGGTDDGGTSSGGGGGDNDGCADLDEGDACVRKDGRNGVCKPDDSDPGVLECDDDTSPSGDDSGSDDDTNLSCSLDAQRSLAGMTSLPLLVVLGLRRRRRAR